MIRIPGWAAKQAGFTCSVDNIPENPKIDNGHIVLKNVPANKNVTCKYDLPTKTESAKVGRLKYQVDWKGYNVTKLVNSENYIPLAPRYL